MFSTDESPERPAMVDGIDLAAYASICRALVRCGEGSARRTLDVLAAAGLSPERWTEIRAAWAERIRLDPEVRAAFHGHYAQIE